MKHAVKLLSAVALLGSAFVSFNAHADCRCATGVPIGGNNCGIPKQPNGTGWQHIFPMTCTVDTPSRSKYEEPKYQYVPMNDKERMEFNKRPEVVYWLDKKTQEVGVKTTSFGNQSNLMQEFKNQCSKNNRDCEVSYFDSHPNLKTCATIYKIPVSRGGTGIFSKSKNVMYYANKTWNNQNQKSNAYQAIKSENGTPIKDICPN